MSSGAEDGIYELDWEMPFGPEELDFPSLASVFGRAETEWAVEWLIAVCRPLERWCGVSVRRIFEQIAKERPDHIGSSKLPDIRTVLLGDPETGLLADVAIGLRDLSERGLVVIEYRPDGDVVFPRPRLLDYLGRFRRS